jgi:hypothetical protein
VAPGVADATVIGSPRADSDELAVGARRRWRIRVHLEGHWPADHLLGVVTWQGPDTRRPQQLAEDHPLRSLVTKVATDPRSRRANSPSPYLRMSAFAARTLVHTGLTPPGLAGSPGTTVNVAGHHVGFDLRPGLSFADIDIDAPEGTESVCLALVRLDLEAALSQRLSRIMLVDVALDAAWGVVGERERLQA